MRTDWQFASVPHFPSFGDGKWIPGDIGGNPDEREHIGEGKTGRIIIIDDDALIAETVREILNVEGFDATAVSSGVAAIDLARTWRPDIVLSDVIMPGLNGIETAIRIREIVPTCRIILFSGQAATVDLLEKARQRGHPLDILPKPIRPEQLITAITTALRHPS